MECCQERSFYSQRMVFQDRPPRGANPKPPLPLFSGFRGVLIGWISSGVAFVSFFRTLLDPDLLLSLGSYNCRVLLLADDEGRLSFALLFLLWFLELLSLFAWETVFADEACSDPKSFCRASSYFFCFSSLSRAAFSCRCCPVRVSFFASSSESS